MAHDLAPQLIRRPVRVLVVGCGGNGSAITARLPFSQAEIRHSKAVVLVSQPSSAVARRTGALLGTNGRGSGGHGPLSLDPGQSSPDMELFDATCLGPMQGHTRFSAAPQRKVDLSADGGRTWSPAQLESSATRRGKTATS